MIDKMTNFNAVGLNGSTEVIGAETVAVLLRDSNGDVLFATGTTVPTDATDGYAKSCIFLDTDVATGTGSMYLNKGTKDSCVFTLVTQAA
jgi:hypothetical protein